MEANHSQQQKVKNKKEPPFIENPLLQGSVSFLTLIVQHLPECAHRAGNCDECLRGKLCHIYYTMQRENCQCGVFGDSCCFVYVFLAAKKMVLSLDIKIPWDRPPFGDHPTEGLNLIRYGSAEGGFGRSVAFFRNYAGSGALPLACLPDRKGDQRNEYSCCRGCGFDVHGKFSVLF